MANPAKAVKSAIKTIFDEACRELGVPDEDRDSTTFIVEILPNLEIARFSIKHLNKKGE